MSSKVVIYCDECGAEKGETNNWKSISGTRSVPRFYTYHDADSDIPSSTWRLDFCGQQCITTVFQRWLDTGSVDRVPPPVAALDVEEIQSQTKEETMEQRSARLYPDGVDHKGDAVWPYSGAR